MRLEEIKERLDGAGLLQLGLPNVNGETPDEACAAAELSCAVACDPGGFY